MPLIIKNLVINDKKQQAAEAEPVSKKLSVSRQPTKQTVDSIKEPSVVVNGKVKKISKKSAFLLDMLSLDD